MGLFDFFKSKYKEIRSESEWYNNGFDPMFEKFSRYIVSKKKCKLSDLQINFKGKRDINGDLCYGIGRIRKIMLALEQAKIIEITDTYPDQSKYLKTYNSTVRDQSSLNKILEDIDTLKKSVMTKDELDQWLTNDLKDDDKVNEPCYLYLMKDFNTGYYKIGISNSPKHREKTLQSEKPTIEMICNKKYVSRRMAHSFEQALHKTFGDKRIRGEWFDLDISDVEEVKSTLNS